MSLERREIERSLLKKGFKLKERDHHYFTYFTINGEKTSVWTKTSHGTSSATLSDSLVNSMARQCGLSNSQFKQLVACPLLQPELETILIETGRINPRQH